MRTAALSLAIAFAFLPACAGEASSTDEPAGTGGSAGQQPQGCADTKPSAMVALPEGFSIDATEASRCQYQAWLDTAPPTTGQDPWCSFNTDFTPQCYWPLAEEGNLPVVCVDWCDAFAYCKAMGKRLCGKIGGGSNATDDFDDPTKSQWYAACSSGGKYEYPYGDEYDQGKHCNDADREAGERYVPVGSLLTCQAATAEYSGVLDLSGNAWEWEDSCAEPSGGGESCRVRGGSLMSPEGYASCGWEMFAARETTSGSVGFRCCLN